MSGHNKRPAALISLNLMQHTVQFTPLALIQGLGNGTHKGKFVCGAWQWSFALQKNRLNEECRSSQLLIPTGIFNDK
jgi:hypothetical protein